MKKLPEHFSAQKLRHIVLWLRCEQNFNLKIHGHIIYKYIYVNLPTRGKQDHRENRPIRGRWQLRATATYNFCSIDVIEKKSAQ